MFHALAIFLIDRGPRDPKLPPDARAVTLALGDGPPATRASPPSPAAATSSPTAPPPPDPDVSPVAAASDPAPTTAAPPSPPSVAVADAGATSPASAAVGVATGVKEDCDIPAALQARLAQDAAARAALARIPSSARSVANAVMLWDGRWAAPAAMGAGAGANPIREVVVRSLELTSSACVRAPVQGPRLLVLDGPNRSTVLAFGSGIWRWSDLLASD